MFSVSRYSRHCDVRVWLESRPGVVKPEGTSAAGEVLPGNAQRFTSRRPKVRMDSEADPINRAGTAFCVGVGERGTFDCERYYLFAQIIMYMCATISTPIELMFLT